MHNIFQRILFLSIVFMLLIRFSGFSKSVSQNDKKDLKKNWLIFDQKFQVYAPFINSTSNPTNSINFIIKKDDASGYELVCNLQQESSLFIEQQIVLFSDSKKKYHFDIDSLLNKFGKEKLFITIFNKALDTEEIQTFLLPRHRTDSKSTKKDVQIILERRLDNFKNFYILSIIIFLILLSVVYNLDTKTFKEFYNLNKTFNLKLRANNTTTSKIFNWPNLIIFFTHSILISFLLIIILYFFDIPLSLYDNPKFDNLFIAIFSWIKLSLIIFSLIMAKYFLVMLISVIMNLKELINVHFFEFIRLSIFIYNSSLIVTGIFLLAFYQPVKDHFIWVIYFITLLSFLRIVLLYIKFLRLTTFRNLYLFSYLCTTEILPFLIGLKIFVLNL